MCRCDRVCAGDVGRNQIIKFLDTKKEFKIQFPFSFSNTLGASSNWTELPPPLFSKVVIMLIDALRDDFVFGSKGVKFMPYTTYLVEKGSSLSFVAEAKPPTVTMPRIKVNSLT